MNEFSNLKVISHKALKHCLIENLGKINIICGKNNSGKTTLLEAINAKEKTIIGEQIIENKLEIFKDAWRSNAANWEFTLNGSMRKFDSLFAVFSPIDIISEIFNESKVWYSDELQVFVDKFTDIIKKKIDFGSHESIKQTYTHYLNKQNTLGAWKKGFLAIFESCFTQVFQDTMGKTCLVSPKRNIVNPSILSKSSIVDSDGKNIISKLFECKNKLSGTNESDFYQKLYKAFQIVSDGYNFDIELEQENLILFFSRINKKEWINAKDCGLGLQDLLIILYFSLESQNSIILIEEPENHIHPEMQRRLIRFLSEETEKQYFITTHSNIFLNTTYANKIFFTSFEKGEIKISDATKRTEILNELGYSVSDNLISDLIILVEGPTDTPIIEEYLKKFGIDATYNIKTWALGGDIMAQLDLTVFAEKYKVIALIDNDPKSGKIRKKFQEKCKELNIPVTRLKRYAIENYFTIRALKEVFKGQIPSNLSDIEPEKPLDEQININVKNNNRKLAQEMTIEEIEGNDLHKFFQKVEKLCES